MALPEVELMHPQLLDLRKPKERDKAAGYIADRNFLLEMKYDGFRCLVRYEDGNLVLRTKQGKEHRNFPGLARSLRAGFRQASISSIIMDGEIVCLDEQSKPSFHTLFYHQQPVTYYAFDMLYCNGKDLRVLPLRKRKVRLKELAESMRERALAYVTDVRGGAEDKWLMFSALCGHNIEGTVLKDMRGPYDARQMPPSWWKIRNPEYAELRERWKLFRQKKKRAA